MSEQQRQTILASLTPEEARTLETAWSFWARPKQVAPTGDWVIWLILAGRGFGKTRSGAEWIRHRVETGQAKRIILAGATADDARDIMIEGESGLLACSDPSFMPEYSSAKARVTWPNGALALVLTADKPDRFRGKQCDTFWADELAAWRYPDAWTQMQLGFRLGNDPRGIVTTTPRPIPIVKDLVKRDDVAVVRGTTYENAAHLSPVFLDQIVRQYEGTRLGRQELNAEILDDNPGALWKRSQIDSLRVAGHPDLVRVVVAVDPAVSANENSDLTGIVVCGIGKDGEGYVLDDVSGIYTPLEWGRRVISAYHEWKADRVVAEVNQGGDLVEANLKGLEASLPFTAVHATRGKQVRAEPIAALYEQGRVHHVGMLAKLEDQMCDWDPALSARSPDRMDALVWALSSLMLKGTTFKTEQKPDIRPRVSIFGDSGGW